MSKSHKTTKKDKMSDSDIDEIDISDIVLEKKVNHISQTITPVIPRVIGFWRPTDHYAYFGQWYESDFELTELMIEQFPEQIKSLGLYKRRIDVLHKLASDQKNFNTAEKFMMLGKAALFRDDVAFNRISESNSPKDQKRLGRTVRNFNETVWDTYAQDIVKIGNYLKFSQDKTLRKNIKNTGDAVLVEGSPLDKIWGVGIRFDDPRIQDEKNWEGTNYLGNCLMFVRHIL